MGNWFTVDKIDSETYIISEYGHWEETHCYLLLGKETALLIDTGLGISDISIEVKKLTDKPIIAVATHCHWDHIGGHKYFKEFYVHFSELEWLNGKFPLPLVAVKKMVSDCVLPENFDIEKYEIFQGKPTKLLNDGDTIDLGERKIEVVHTPGHSPGHMCFYEKERKYLYSGDLIYKGTLYANYPSTDPKAYLSSVEKVSKLSVKRVFPAHHSLNVKPDMIAEIKSELTVLKNEGKLCHKSGKFVFKDWEILL